MSRYLKTTGIVIKRRNSGEADRFLTVFTKDFGKLTVKAKGVRKTISKRASHIELLNYAALSLYKGTGMPTLTETHVLDDFHEVKENLARVSVAYHICELIDGLCPDEQENKAVFYLLYTFLLRLKTSRSLLTIISEFEEQLLKILGFWNEEASHEKNFTLHDYIESLLERKLKSKRVFHTMKNHTARSD